MPMMEMMIVVEFIRGIALATSNQDCKKCQQRAIYPWEHAESGSTGHLHPEDFWQLRREDVQS